MKSSVREVFGIAGSGKTTFAHNHDLYNPLKLSLLYKIPIFFWAVVEQAPLILKVGRIMKSMKSIRVMCFMMYKLRMVSFFKRRKKGLFIYDQGPIYNLVMLMKRINPDQEALLKTEIAYITHRIRNILDGSFYIDCDIDTAFDRVLLREKDQKLKKMTREEARKELLRWKEAYDNIAEELSSQRIEIQNDTRSNAH